MKETSSKINAKIEILGLGLGPVNNLITCSIVTSNFKFRQKALYIPKKF